MSQSKRYYEIVASAATTMNDPAFGIGKAAASATTSLGSDTNSYGYYKNGDVKFNNATAATGLTYAVGDVIGVLLDEYTSTLYFYKNNVPSCSIAGVSASVWYPMAVLDEGDTATANFSPADWVYTPAGAYGFDGIDYVPYIEFGLWDFTNANGAAALSAWNADSTAVVTASVGGLQGFSFKQSGQRFFRIIPKTFPTDQVSFYGIAKDGLVSTAYGGNTNSCGVMRNSTNGVIWTNGAIDSYVYPFSTESPIEVYVDFDAGQVSFDCEGAGPITAGTFTVNGQIRAVFSGADNDEAALVTDYSTLSQHILPVGFETFLPWEDDLV